MTRILIADDHEMIRKGLREVLEEQSGWVVCGEATDGRAAVARTLELRPDVLVLDFSMPELNGLEVTRQVRAARLPTEVLILTMHKSEQLARAALAAGALGFVLKSDAGTTLVTAVEHLSRHQPFSSIQMSPLAICGGLGTAGSAGEERPAGDRLTPREREILQLIAEGRGSKQVAVALGISLKTVETHRANLMRKLGIHSVSGLVRYAIREKIAAP
jgi:DNA-binding NarL/FixJ family response regulator